MNWKLEEGPAFVWLRLWWSSRREQEEGERKKKSSLKEKEWLCTPPPPSPSLWASGLLWRKRFSGIPVKWVGDQWKPPVLTWREFKVTAAVLLLAHSHTQKHTHMVAHQDFHTPNDVRKGGEHWGQTGLRSPVDLLHFLTFFFFSYWETIKT